MPSDLLGVCFDANDPARLAKFWAGVLQRELVDGLTGSPTLASPDDSGFQLRFAPTDVPKTLQNRVHLDLTSDTWERQAGTVERALALGGRHIDIGQAPEDEHVVLADPQGNEFCVIEPGNSFLAGCGSSARSTATAPGSWGTSGAGRWTGRWCGTRTRRRRSSRHAVAARSRGVVHR